MKNKFLGTVAAFAFVATGVAALAQENPRQDSKGVEHAPAAAPRAEPGGAMQRKEGPKAAQGEQQPGAAMGGKEAPKAAEGEKREPNGAAPGKDSPKAAQTERREENGAAPKGEAPKAAQGEKREPNGAAPGKEGPKAAQGERREENGAASKGEAPKAAQGEKREPNGAMPGKDEPKAAQGEKRGGTETMRQGQNGENKAGRTAARGEPRVNGVKISTEHAARIGETLHREGRVERPNFDIRVGVRVPEGFEIRPLPEEIVQIEPEYRGYDYFVDANDEIVFVSPESHEIVGTITYEGRAAAVDSPRAARPCPPEN